MEYGSVHLFPVVPPSFTPPVNQCRQIFYPIFCPCCPYMNEVLTGLLFLNTMVPAIGRLMPLRRVLRTWPGGCTQPKVWSIPLVNTKNLAQKLRKEGAAVPAPFPVPVPVPVPAAPAVLLSKVLLLLQTVSTAPNNIVRPL